MMTWLATLGALTAAATLSSAPQIEPPVTVEPSPKTLGGGRAHLPIRQRRLTLAVRGHEMGVPPFATGVDRTVARRFLSDLQRAIAQVDKRRVASLAAYPIRVMVSGLDVPVLSATELVRLFDVVFTPDMRCAIVDARIDDADPPRARVPVAIAGDGLSIGSGMIWAQSTGAALKITRITVRQATVVPPSRPRPRRIEFVARHGILRETFSGRLANDGTDSYVLSARVGQVLDIIIEGFRGRDAALRVLDHKSSTPLVATAPHGPRTWTATLPATGEYRIEVARRAPYCDPPFTYSLDVVLR